MMQFLLVAFLANHSRETQSYTAQVVTVQTATLQGCFDADKAIRRTVPEHVVIRSTCTRINP